MVLLHGAVETEREQLLNLDLEPMSADEAQGSCGTAQLSKGCTPK